MTGAWGKAPAVTAARPERGCRMRERVWVATAGLVPLMLAGVAAGPGSPAAPGPGIITTVAGGPGRGPAWSLAQDPQSLAVGPDDTVYVGDSGGVVHEFTESASWEKVVAGVGGAQGPGVLTYDGDNGPATRAHLSPVSGMAVDAAGNLVIAHAGNNRVRVVAEHTGSFYGQPMTAGDIYTVAGSGRAGDAGDAGPATAALLNRPGAVAVDAAGNLVMADTGNSQIRVVAERTGTFYGQPMTAGDIYRIAGDVKGDAGDGGPALLASLRHPGAVAIDAAGNVVMADTGNSRIRVVAERTGTFYGQPMAAGNTYRIAGNVAGFSGDGGPATSAYLSSPSAVSLDGSGNVVIADSVNRRVRVVAATTGTFYGQPMTAGDIYTIAGDDQQGYGGDGGPASSAGLSTPEGLAFDGDGNLLITGGGRVRIVAAAAGTFYGRPMTAGDIYTVAGRGPNASPGAGVPARDAVLGATFAVAATGSGNVAICADIQVLLVPAAPGTFFGQAMAAGHIYAVTTPAQVDCLQGLASDGHGNLLIADPSNQKISVVAGTTGTFYGQPMTAGDVYTIAGNGENGFSGDGGPATSAELSFPQGVSVDGNGNVVIADTLNERVRVVAATTGTFYGQPMTAGDIYTIAGNGNIGFSGDGGPATSAEMTLPEGLAVDGAGNVVIDDSDNNRVRVVAPATGTFYGQPMTAGDIYTIAGNGNLGSSGDGGPATSAELGLPEGLSVDGAGNVVIADTDNNRVRVVALVTGTFYGQAMTAGDIYTIAGNGRYGYFGDGHPATQARLAFPDGVAVDGTTLFIADQYNGVIREVGP